MHYADHRVIQEDWSKILLAKSSHAMRRVSVLSALRVMEMSAPILAEAIVDQKQNQIAEVIIGLDDPVLPFRPTSVHVCASFYVDTCSLAVPLRQVEIELSGADQKRC